jgi:hypothetical protein
MNGELHVPSWQDLEATRRGLLREVNDRIAEVGAGFERAELPFVCECGSQDCIRAIDLSLREYESVRLHARRFAIVPDHENPTVEIVVQETGRFGRRNVCGRSVSDSGGDPPA